jgi:hypothetical protein
MAQASSGTLKVLLLIMVIILGLLAYSLYQDSVLEGQVQSLQLQNDVLQLSVQAQGLKIELLQAKLSTTSSTPLHFEITSACVSVAQGCPPGGAAQGAGYFYSFGIKDTGTTPLSSTLPVYLSFKDTTVAGSFAFNSTLPGTIAPNSTAYLQATAWPSGVNGTSKLSAGDSVGVAITIGSVENDIATAVVACTPSTSTITTGNGTMTQTFTCA